MADAGTDARSGRTWKSAAGDKGGTLVGAQTIDRTGHAIKPDVGSLTANHFDIQRQWWRQTPDSADAHFGGTPHCQRFSTFKQNSAATQIDAGAFYLLPAGNRPIHNRTLDRTALKTTTLNLAHGKLLYLGPHCNPEQTEIVRNRVYLDGYFQSYDIVRRV
jgi:hypothetical protein